MNEIKLLPHNKKMVTEIEKAIVEGNHKIFYTQATGLGKSYIFMYLVNKYFKDKKVLYICPKNHIWYNMTSYKEFDLIKDNVTYICNVDFNKIKQRHLGFDVIFIDEAHHLTAPIQGENILKVMDMTLENNPNAYVFGFTATPYINGEMIGYKYFNTSVIGMDLLDAIDAGILQKIDYVVALKEEESLIETKQDLLEKYSIDTSSVMITNIVKEYTNVNHWLAYFPYIKELEENLPYFEKYFPEFKIFVIHSDIEESENILKEFEMYNGKAILVSVSMLLEGIHPKSVEGILLYRNVYADNTFLQIIGRLGIMSPNVHPICVDVYCSYDNLVMTNRYVRSSTKNNDNIREYNSRDYININIDTYKILELSKVLYNLRYNNIHEYRGIYWTSDSCLSKQLGKYSTYVAYNLSKGKTYEEIIDDYIIMSAKRELNSYRGITWKNPTDLAKKLGKEKSYIYTCLHRGKSYEEIIDKYFNTQDTLKTYKGFTWKNNSDLSRQLGRRDNYVYNKIYSGKSYEEIIDDYLTGNNTKYVNKINKRYLTSDSRSYKGFTWKTDTDLSRQLGKGYKYVSNLLYKGKTYEEIIDNIVNGKEPIVYKYRGITWSSDLELTKKLNKSNAYLWYHIKRGKTREDLIDIFLDNSNKHEYRGISWSTDSELANKIHKSNSYVSISIKNGKTREDLIDIFLDKN